MPSYIYPKRCSTYPPEIVPIDPPPCLTNWLVIGSLLRGHLLTGSGDVGDVIYLH